MQKENSITWAKQTIKVQGIDDAIRIAENHATDRLGKEEYTIPNPFKNFYQSALDFMRAHKRKMVANAN